MSPDLLDHTLLPLIRRGDNPVLLLLDNLTLDQWITAKPLFATHFDTAADELYTAILPTSTQYCRNSIMSALMPADIARRFPSLWVDETDDTGKNEHEEQLLRDWISRRRLTGCTLSYHRTTDNASLQHLARDFRSQPTAAPSLSVIIVSFTDMLSHAVASDKMLREIARSDSAYRSLLLSWLSHSPLPSLLEAIAASRRPLVVTTDHGSIRVSDAVKVTAEAGTTPAMRYKFSRNIAAPARRVFTVRPAEAALPATSQATTCTIASRRDFMLYPNDFNHYARTFAGSYQHGGISMQEMLLPLITLQPK